MNGDLRPVDNLSRFEGKRMNEAKKSIWAKTKIFNRDCTCYVTVI